MLDDLRGSRDANGRPLEVTVRAVGDEIAAAADLVKGKADNLPVALIRGLGQFVVGLDAPGARSIVRDADHDMFRQGSAEARAEGFAAGLAAGLTGADDAHPGDGCQVDSRASQWQTPVTPCYVLVGVDHEQYCPED